MYCLCVAIAPRAATLPAEGGTRLGPALQASQVPSPTQDAAVHGRARVGGHRAPGSRRTLNTCRAVAGGLAVPSVTLRQAARDRDGAGAAIVDGRQGI